MDVRCKVSFIVDGNFIRAGSVVGIDRIPKGLRLKKFVEKVSPMPVSMAPPMLTNGMEESEESEKASPSREKQLKDFVKRIPKGG